MPENHLRLFQLEPSRVGHSLTQRRAPIVAEISYQTDPNTFSDHPKFQLLGVTFLQAEYPARAVVLDAQQLNQLVAGVQTLVAEFTTTPPVPTRV